MNMQSNNSRTFASRVLLFAVAFGLLMLLPILLSACPFCSETVAQQKSAGLAQGLSYSVIGLASMPFVLFGTVATVIYRAFRRHRESDQDRIGRN